MLLNRCYALELGESSLDRLFLGGDHQDAYLPNEPLPSEPEIFLQLASGLLYIHENNFIHLDIKPDNILIFLEAPANGGRSVVKMKLCDFGLSERTDVNGNCFLNNLVGADSYRAPEVQKGADGRIRVTAMGDTFAMAIVFFNIITRGSHPFGEKHKIIVENIGSYHPLLIGSIREDHFAFNFIEDCLKCRNHVDRSRYLEEAIELFSSLINSVFILISLKNEKY